MSIRYTTDMFCDECNYWQGGCTSTRPQGGVVQKAARAAGWTTRRATDGQTDWICPRCNGKKPNFWGHSGGSKRELAR